MAPCSRSALVMSYRLMGRSDLCGEAPLSRAADGKTLVESGNARLSAGD